MGEEMGAAIVGAAIAALVAVVLFVIERSVSRHAAFVERRRLAFDEVMTSFTSYAAAAIDAKGKPASQYGAQLVTSRARMTLALRKRERPLSWWLTGMEIRLARAADIMTADFALGMEGVQAVAEDLVNTLLDTHLGVLRMYDFVTPGALFWLESRGVDVDEKYPDEITAAIRPRPNRSIRGPIPTLQRAWIRSSRWVLRSLGRAVPAGWIPAWAVRPE